MAMLTVALVAGVAAAVLGDFGHAVAHLSGRHDQAQARWLARGAIDWARNVLEEDTRRGGANGVDHLREDWTTKVPPTAVEEGEVSGELLDLSGRFNLNSLISGGAINQDQASRYLRLLGLLDVPPRQAEQMTAALIDWIDTDGAPTTFGSAEAAWYRSQTRRDVPPNAPLLDLAELTKVQGYDEAIVGRLRRYVCVLPGNVQQININTAEAEVLAAHVDGLPIDAARTLVANRERVFFTQTQEFFNQLPANARYNASQFSVQSHYFLGVGRASWGDAVTRIEVLMHRPVAQRPEILWQKIL